MTLLVEYKCEQTIPSKYQLSTRNIKQVKYINNKHMQDIKISERERDEQSQTWEICFEVRVHLLYVPVFNTKKDFHYNDPTRSLSAATPTTSSLKNSWTRKSLTYSRKNNTRKHTSLRRPHLL